MERTALGEVAGLAEQAEARRGFPWCAAGLLLWLVLQ